MRGNVVKRMLVINNSPIGKRDHIKLPEMLIEMSEAKRQLNVNQSEHFVSLWTHLQDNFEINCA